MQVTLQHYTATTCLGLGRKALWRGLMAGQTGLRANDFTDTPLLTPIGRVAGLEAMPLPAHLIDYDCRNNRLAYLAITQEGFLYDAMATIAECGSDRVAVLMGTSTSSIKSTEEAYVQQENGEFPQHLKRPVIHNMHSLGQFVQALLGTTGPCMTVNTACSSSAKVFAQAERMMRMGLIDAAVVGGVDTLCGNVLFGFNSLQLLSDELCRPFDQLRKGINLGEAGGFALLSRKADKTSPKLVGWGESSDAHHMSSPHPEGLGAELAMQAALRRAGLSPIDIDAINAHGTSSLKNDEVEAMVVARLFPTTARMSSTKAYTGHTLGAAGIVEAVVSLLALEHHTVVGNLGCHQPDNGAEAHLALGHEAKTITHHLSNNFGFGGNNCALIFKRGGV